MRSNGNRDKTRIDFETEVFIKAAAEIGVTSANSKNISMKGMFVRTNSEISIGTDCDVEVALKGTTKQFTIKIKGTVVRKTTKGLGISFNAIDVESYFHLKKLLLYNSNDPDAFPV